MLECYLLSDVSSTVLHTSQSSQSVLVLLLIVKYIYCLSLYLSWENIIFPFKLLEPTGYVMKQQV